MPYYRAVVQAASAPERIGVLLVNLGTPDAPTYWAVQRYLREFLSDRRVIDTAPWIWLPILYGLILPFSPLRTARSYRQIWMPEGSPLGVYSTRLAAGIQARLCEAGGDRVTVALGMSYGNPSIESAIQALAERNVKRLLVLPLHPQYCSATTGSAFDRTARALARWRWLPETRFLSDYHRDAGYLDAWTRQIEEHWRRTGGRTHLLFSYHGAPASYAERGDPYRTQAEATTRALAARLGLAEGTWSHCYQSRFGTSAWLEPYLEDTLQSLIGRGVRTLTVVSPSFAVDCLETLKELGVDYRDRFLAQGGERFSLVPGLNDAEGHVDALSKLIRGRLGGWI